LYLYSHFYNASVFITAPTAYYGPYRDKLLITSDTFFFFFQALNFLVESFGLLNDLFPLPSILDAGYPVFDLHLANVLCDVILPSVLGSSL
jgi:hypothetical protein